ncbi:hypothetical protein CONPUDRAFT_85903 [Coniophora puteana RWD-64-598 SS2]|uniref:Uncharacterized protein n=1 Tax=Coniophora puteana (strain RWD-64-598) TaxID=741705 RepID=R7SFB2_CONPW|nr:uncharacterized protein CONPUDRAFT_85903 [Coniophora puteana RWD-64-598 SS2]EIW74437.1 hypothetical protein CONPUDRAFT_85903 [Coniophora puteana RWD-64-598 SS2]
MIVQNRDFFSSPCSTAVDSAVAGAILVNSSLAMSSDAWPSENHPPGKKRDDVLLSCHLHDGFAGMSTRSEDAVRAANDSVLADRGEAACSWT